MADITITKVAPANFNERQFTGPAGVDIQAGQYVRLATASGKIVLGNAQTPADARTGGIALNTVVAGQSVTVAAQGAVLDVGNVLSGLDYDANVYLSDTDGLLSDDPGTVSKIVGRVVPAWGHTTADKLLEIAFVSVEADMVETGDIQDGAVTTAKIADGAVTAEKMAQGAAIAALAAAGLGAADSYDSTTDAAETLLAANASAEGDRVVLIVVHVDEVFADGTGAQPTFTIGQTGTADKFAAAAAFTDAAAGDVFVFAGTLTEEAALLVTGTAATENATGGITVSVLALPAAA